MTVRAQGEHRVAAGEVDGSTTTAGPRGRPELFQVRFHGRGGQGVVTAAELLSVAAFLQGRFAQAFPSFGSERAGAPVVAFCRISGTEIRTHAPVDAPDAVVVQDATLLHQVDLFNGLGPEGYLLVNTTHSLDDMGLGGLADRLHRERIVTVPATDLALEYLGRPVPNVVLLGGLAALCGVVSLDSVVAAVHERFAGAVADGNAAAATEAYRLVTAEAKTANKEAAAHA
jgi:pyruvate ferredoxin oxidoreductase gamma subunit